MIFDLINGLGSFLTIWGTWEVQKAHANLRKINLLYFFGCLIFICFFSIQGLWINVGLYIILGIFAIRGIRNHRIPRLATSGIVSKETLKLL